MAFTAKAQSPFATTVCPSRKSVGSAAGWRKLSQNQCAAHLSLMCLFIRLERSNRVQIRGGLGAGKVPTRLHPTGSLPRWISLRPKSNAAFLPLGLLDEEMHPKSISFGSVFFTSPLP